MSTEIHWDDDNESLVLAGKRYVPETRLLMLRKALRECVRCFDKAQYPPTKAEWADLKAGIDKAAELLT